MILFNSRRTSNWSFAVLLLCLVWPAVSQAQRAKGSANQRDEKRENERVRKAQREFDQARQSLNLHQADLRTAIKKLDQSEDVLAQAKRALREAEKSAELEIGQTLGLPAAYADLQQSQAKLAELSRPVLDKMHSTDQWKTLESQVAQAKLERDELKENLELEEAERLSRLKELSTIILRPYELEETTIAGDPDCLAAKKEVEDRSAKLAELRKKITANKVKWHPQVVKVQKELDKAEDSLDKTEKNLIGERNKATKAQRAYQQAQIELARAKQADAADTNKGKRK